MAQYTDAVFGEFKKFYPDGSVREFPGNTFICHIRQQTPFFRFAYWAQSEMMLLDCSYKFGFLPPNSFHMTVYEGVCDQVRQPNNWVKHLPLDTTLPDMTSYFFNKIPNLYKPKGFMMKVKSIEISPGMHFLLEPANEQTAKDLDMFRSVINEVTGMVNHNSEGYQFHCSLAYILQELTSNEISQVNNVLEKIKERMKPPFDQIELGAVEFCYFNDMFRYFPIAVLK